MNTINKHIITLLKGHSFNTEVEAMQPLVKIGFKREPPTENEIKLLLLRIYFDIDKEKIDKGFIRLLVSRNIIAKAKPRGVKWLIPLFVKEKNECTLDIEQLNNIKYRFNEVSDKPTSVNEIKKRIEKMFTNYKEISYDEIIICIDKYLEGISDPKYIMSAHYFFYKETTSQCMIIYDSINDYI